MVLPPYYEMEEAQEEEQIPLPLDPSHGGLDNQGVDLEEVQKPPKKKPSRFETSQEEVPEEGYIFL